MFRFVFLILFLSLDNVCAEDVSTIAPKPPTTTLAPTSEATTLAPTSKATTLAPTTIKPTTLAPPTEPTTLPPAPTTLPPTTLPPAPPTTLPPAPPTNATTAEPITNATTVEPITNATTVEPITNATTVEPITNATTVVPTTNATTVAPTTPTPPLPTPATGEYSIKQNNASSACLKADFGLRIGFKQGDKVQEINLDPNVTKATGNCGANSSQLILTSSDKTIITLSFSNDVKNFRLHSLKLTIQTVNFTAVNTNLSLWQAAVGSSYMCKKEQTFNITDTLTLYTYELRVQPFNVTQGQYSTAEECFMDADFTFLVPIAVGVALSFLIILVLISYLIGRRKSRTGYQSV